MDKSFILYLIIMFLIVVAGILLVKPKPKVKNKLHLRVALLNIRKIRRDEKVPNHEEDEIYKIATKALNDDGFTTNDALLFARTLKEDTL